MEVKVLVVLGDVFVNMGGRGCILGSWRGVVEGRRGWGGVDGIVGFGWGGGDGGGRVGRRWTLWG